MLNILQLHNEYKFFGGEDTVVEAERNLLLKNGHSVTQLIRQNELEINNTFDAINTLKNLHYSNKSNRILFEKFDNTNLPEIVHIHNLFPLWTYSVLDFFKKKKVPIVMTLHNYRMIWGYFGIFDKRLVNYGYFKNSKIKTFIVSKLIDRRKKLLNYVDKFITFSEFTKAEFLKSGLPDEKFVIKPNFLNDKKIEIKKSRQKNDAIYASRISEEKGINTLLSAWKSLDIKINIYGGGSILTDLIKKNSNNNKLVFHGSQNRQIVEEKLSNSKFLVFPSEWYETMGMTILEGFRSGTLVIASNLGVMRHIIKDKYNGILFESGNYKDLQDKIRWVLDNPDRCDLITKNALSDFNNNFSEKPNYEQLIKIYTDVITNYNK